LRRSDAIGEFDDLYFQVLFENQHPAADYDPSAPIEPYLLLQRQFEDADRVLLTPFTPRTRRTASSARSR
jgi:hypothetical protein